MLQEYGAKVDDAIVGTVKRGDLVMFLDLASRYDPPDVEVLKTAYTLGRKDFIQAPLERTSIPPRDLLKRTLISAIVDDQFEAVKAIMKMTFP